MNQTIFPTLADIYKAWRRIGGLIRQTPLVLSERLSHLWGGEVYLKLENLQLTGTFKARGAANKIFSLTEEEKKRGVIAFSTGNHGRATAYICRSLGLPVVICLSERVPSFRVEAMKALGAEVVAHGQSQDEAYQKALEIKNDRRLTMVAPFDDFEVICGQGTIALEIISQLPEVKTVVVPLSGGGLFSGVALALKSINPSINTIGVSMTVAPAMIRSLQAGKPVEIPEVDSLADALLGGIGLDNQLTFELTRCYLDRFAEVTEEEIGRSMAQALIFERQVIEGSGAVGLAALESDKITGPSPMVIVVSGGNVDMTNLLRLVEKYKT
ncbi:MAG: threonine/serine dehydratase [Deltaproteobacteria bacterium]|nr:threonine/serine dehydratase [Deltaproteobacteria bacterium]